MPFHLHVPHAHELIAIALSSGLAFTAGALLAKRQGLRDVWRKRFERRSAETARVRGTQADNNAFEAYRSETLKRLDDEAKQFRGYLDDLRRARDQAEFDAYRNARRGLHSDH